MTVAIEGVGAVREPPLQLNCKLPARFTTTAAATAATTAVPTPTAATAAEVALGFRPRFVHGQRASAELCLIERLSRALSFFVGRHLDEREPARPSRGHVPHHADAVDRAMLREEILEFRLTCRIREVADEQFPTH
jgi:hypothetical protein